ncbi:GAF and ANTAR domain-containing protein [Arthrobacter sp. EH-1B-1]|uniref:GAF and ANTAR domain-containing protein n=1 Tax=Arthrobacter vasquezii TaxID=2977629 RepID=A0ABT6D305_9MICC|nr:GAF and ANTAR domain-containing protein [Arthrobacter vasquezii]MDF9279284.1 GAF and ANTAR domain-containing protein [Arthrobacter vasquezii]
MSELARELQSAETEEAILSDLVQAAVEIIPGTDEASISVVLGRKNVDSHAPTGDLPAQVDALQMKVGQGPCLDAVFNERTVLVADMSKETRWPKFSRAAYQLGAHSMLSFQLYVEGDNLGALNLYGRQVGAFTEESEHVGLLVAAHAAVVFADYQKLDQYKQAMDTRDLIGQAKGILMERFKINDQQAFVILTKASSLTNTKLRDVAVHLAHTGEILAEVNAEG